MTCTHPTRPQGSGAMSPLVINGESHPKVQPNPPKCKSPMPMISETVHHTYIANELCVVWSEPGVWASCRVQRHYTAFVVQVANGASCLYPGRWCLNDCPSLSSSLPGCLTLWHPAPRLAKKETLPGARWDSAMAGLDVRFSQQVILVWWSEWPWTWTSRFRHAQALVGEEKKCILSQALHMRLRIFFSAMGTHVGYWNLTLVCI